MSGVELWDDTPVVECGPNRLDESSTQDLSSALYHEFNMRTFAPKNLETFRFI